MVPAQMGCAADPTGGSLRPPAVLRWREQGSFVARHPSTKGSSFAGANGEPKGQQSLQGDPKQKAVLWLMRFCKAQKEKVGREEGKILA